MKEKVWTDKFVASGCYGQYKLLRANDGFKNFAHTNDCFQRYGRVGKNVS